MLSHVSFPHEERCRLSPRPNKFVVVAVIVIGPEWFLSFLLRALAAYRPLLEDDGADANDSIVGGGVDRVAYFARGVALIARYREYCWTCCKYSKVIRVGFLP